MAVNNDFSVIGSSPLTFSGTATLAGTTRTITNNNSAATTFAGISNGSTDLVFAGSGTTSVTGTIGSGSGGLTMNGTGGTLILSGANTYLGSTTITAGTLQLVTGGSLPAGSAVSGTGSVPVNGISPGTLSFNYSGTSTFSNNISGNVNVSNQSANTLSLAGTNSFTGTLFVNAGTVQLASASAVGSGNVTFAGGALQYTASSTALDVSSEIVNSTSPITIDTNGQTVTFAGDIASNNTAGLTKLNTGTLILAGANAYTGTTLVSAGTLQIGNGGSTGLLPGNVTDNASLVFDLDNSLTYTGTISGSGTLTQAGSATLTLAPRLLRHRRPSSSPAARWPPAPPTPSTPPAR